MSNASKNILVWGTANPEGMSDSYNGVFLNRSEISDMIQQVRTANEAGNPIPVKIEHAGSALGHVVSAWENQGRLECVFELNEKMLEGSIGAEFIRTGVCKDLSLGYTMQVEQSRSGWISRKKNLNEISIVRKGARNKCHIHAFTS
jgi:hypothetical protein